jgi:hypothetical protein
MIRKQQISRHRQYGVKLHALLMVDNNFICHSEDCCISLGDERTMILFGSNVAISVIDDAVGSTSFWFPLCNSMRHGICFDLKRVQDTRVSKQIIAGIDLLQRITNCEKNLSRTAAISGIGALTYHLVTDVFFKANKLAER